MPSPDLIDTASALEQCVQALRGRPSLTLFIDTEFDSTRNGSTLCLVQVSDGARTFLIDPLRVNLSPLAGVLSAPGTEWVLHAGRQDVALLCDQLRIPLPDRLFDTQIAWALVSPEASVSLAYLEFRLLGLRSDKGHQADDWKRRPLPPSQLAYAARDVEHLPALHRALSGRLAAVGRASIVYEASREVLQPPTDPPAPLTLASFRNAWQLDARGQAALQALFAWAQTLPVHPTELLPDSKTWLAIAGRLPTSPDDLARIKGVPGRLASEHGHTIAQLMARAAAEANTDSFVPLDPPPYATHEEILARARLELIRAHACHQLDAAPELVLPNRLLDILRAILLTTGDAEGLLDAITGFRRVLLAPVWAQAVRKASPVAPAEESALSR